MQPPIPGLESYLTSNSGNFDPKLRAALDAGVDPRLIRTIGLDAAIKTTQGANKGKAGAQEFLSGFSSSLSGLPARRS